MDSDPQLDQNLKPTGNLCIFFYKYVTFRLILKKSYQDGVFEFLYPDPQLDQNLKPTRNLSGHFIYIYVYISVVFNIS